MNYIQIGTNKGNDDFFNIISDNKIKSNIFLVEPNATHNDDIEKCYDGLDYEIHNVVISNINGMIDFFTHPSMEENLLIASIDKNHILKHGGYSRFSEKEFILHKVQSYTPNIFFELIDVTQIEILFIDSEGCDFDIIQSIDYSIYDIKNIYFENLHLDLEKTISFLSEKDFRVVDRNFGYNGWTTHMATNK